MTDKKVSIIIPHYNSLELLKNLISTIPNREEIQIIVIDDNSTKDKAEYDLFRQNNSRILFLCNEYGKNSAGRCRNMGLEKAEGEWLLFADADDFFTENLWEKVVPYLEQKEFDIVYFRPMSCMLETGEEATRHVRVSKLISDFLEKPDFYHKTRLKYWFEAPWSKLIRRSVVEENKIVFDTTKVANDIMFSMKTAVAAKDVTASAETIYCITQSTGTLTTTPGRENFEGRFEVFLRKHRFLKEALTAKEWRVVDILGEPYLKMARRNGMTDAEVKDVKKTLRREGVRIKFSRKWTPVYIIKKVWKKIR